MTMTKPEIPAKLKRLFDYGTMKDEKDPREYRFYDFTGKEKTAYLSDDDILAEKLRCPRDGVRIANYSGDPHRVSECPNCGYSPSQGNLYSREKDLTNLAEKIKNTEAELAKLKARWGVIQDPNHPIVQANLRDSAMAD